MESSATISSPSCLIAFDKEVSPSMTYTKRQKLTIVALTSVASLFSPFSVNSYFPATTLIERDLNTTTRQIHFTISLYMIFQAIFPSFWSYWADTKGRRPVYLITLLLYICSNIGLAKSTSFSMLLSFRVLQAIGASSVIGIGAGSIADITTPEERGSYQGLFSVGFSLGIASGPAVGGVISQYLGWRAIFWLVGALCMVHWFLLFLFLPETLPLRASNVHSMFWQQLQHHRRQQHQQQRKRSIEIQLHKRDDEHDDDDDDIPKAVMLDNRQKATPLWERCLMPFCEPLYYVRYKDMLMLILLYAFQYAANYTVIAMIPAVVGERDDSLNSWSVCFLYLANGSGCVIGSIAQGYILNYDYALSSSRSLEYARLKRVWLIASIYNLFLLIMVGVLMSVLLFVFLYYSNLFVMGYTCQSMFNSIQTLLTDLFPDKSTATNACNNFFRCLLGAFATMVIDPLSSQLDYGWTYSLVSGILLCSRVFLFWELKYGQQWREARLP